MKEKYLYLIYTLAVILVIFTAGCVAPPQENPPPVSGNLTKKVTTKPPTYVAVVTLSPDVTSTVQTVGHSSLIQATPIPEDITCYIHSINLTGYNGTAFIFNLKNPPMFINYAVVPKNVSEIKVFTENGETRTLKYSTYSPISWFEVTVRDNRTKQIILQDGFGTAKGYSTYLNRTLKILTTGDIQVEFRSNDMIKASATIWIKPRENFDESRLSEFTKCAYWEGRRDTIATAKPTTIKGVIYTWTPENVVTKAPAATMVKQGSPTPVRNASDYDW